MQNESQDKSCQTLGVIFLSRRLFQLLSEHDKRQDSRCTLFQFPFVPFSMFWLFNYSPDLTLLITSKARNKKFLACKPVVTLHGHNRNPSAPYSLHHCRVTHFSSNLYRKTLPLMDDPRFCGKLLHRILASSPDWKASRQRMSLRCDLSSWGFCLPQWHSVPPLRDNYLAASHAGHPSQEVLR